MFQGLPQAHHSFNLAAMLASKGAMDHCCFGRLVHQDVHQEPDDEDYICKIKSSIGACSRPIFDGADSLQLRASMFHVSFKLDELS